jgi:hypothetical protein
MQNSLEENVTVGKSSATTKFEISLLNNARWRSHDCAKLHGDFYPLAYTESGRRDFFRPLTDTRSRPATTAVTLCTKRPDNNTDANTNQCTKFLASSLRRRSSDQRPTEIDRLSMQDSNARNAPSVVRKSREGEYLNKRVILWYGHVPDATVHSGIARFMIIFIVICGRGAQTTVTCVWSTVTSSEIFHTFNEVNSLSRVHWLPFWIS